MNASHLNLHKMTMAEYRDMFPNAEIVCEARRVLHSEMMKAIHQREGGLQSKEGRRSISEKLKRRHAEGKMPHGETHWSHGKLKFKGEWIPQEEVKIVLEELVAQDMILAQMAEECKTDPKTVTNWLKRFNMQQGIRKGSRCPWWRGGHEKYRGPGWLTVRAKMLERDEYKCQHCGMTQEDARERGHALSVHHIVPWRETHDNSPKNLITLCQGCHMKMEWGND